MSEPYLLTGPDDFMWYKQQLDNADHTSYVHYGSPGAYPCLVTSAHRASLAGPDAVVHFFVYPETRPCPVCDEPTHTWPAPVDASTAAAKDREREARQALWKIMAEAELKKPLVLTPELRAVFAQPVLSEKARWVQQPVDTLTTAHPLQDFTFPQYRTILDLERAFAACKTAGVTFVFSACQLYPYLAASSPTNQQLGTMVEDAYESNEFIHDGQNITDLS